jgi:hypothetical protein
MLSPAYTSFSHGLVALLLATRIPVSGILVCVIERYKSTSRDVEARERTATAHRHNP